MRTVVHGDRGAKGRVRVRSFFWVGVGGRRGGVTPDFKVKLNAHSMCA
jgi:hypothetical protein